MLHSSSLEPRRPQWILEGDIKACFDRISHDWLLATSQWTRPSSSKWLKAGYMERHVLHPTEMGTPQGGIISPVLANLTLDGLQRELHTHFPKPKAGQSPLVNLVRYADDFIITGSSKELLEHEVRRSSKHFCTRAGWNSRKRRPASRISSTGLIFWARMYASTTASYSSSRPRRTSRPS